jgi:DNA-binding MarR family transcriptional regulator
MQLTLQPEEATLLKQVLTRFVSDLKMEISNTEKYEMREELKADEATLKSIIERLEQAGVAG